MKLINEISERQFNAYCYARQPMVRVMTREVAWFEAANRKLLGVVIHDFRDNDFGYVILGRDKRRLFRCIKVSKKFFSDSLKSISALQIELEIFALDGTDLYEQFDEKAPTHDIYDLKVAPSKLHPYFEVLLNNEKYKGARALIREAVHSHIDVDGHYLQQFQTDGFSARLWELFLYLYFYNAWFEFDNDFNAPDYKLLKEDKEIFVEAVTVNANPEFDVQPPSNPKEILEVNQDYIPIKYGSPLFSKLNKKYWEKENVKGRPLILAIHDYHQGSDDFSIGSMTWSRTGLHDYLYGYRAATHIDGEGKIIFETEVFDGLERPKMEKIETHAFKGKIIPSGFFLQPDAENISAVLYSNGATLPTFARMARLAGLDDVNLKILRHLARPSPAGFLPKFEVSDIDDPSYEESWADTITMYHNPFAKYPTDINLFDDITHLWFDYKAGEFRGPYSHNAVYSSLTQFVNVKPSAIK
ncbi:MAG: hypothetical protein LCH83_13745 [Proteobacteria bacterium]|nr:hypothetical protein [Pseudomonadota bacterium]